MQSKSITLRETLEKRKRKMRSISLYQKMLTYHYGMQVNYSYSNGVSNRWNLKESKKESKENCKESKENNKKRMLIKIQRLLLK